MGESLAQAYRERFPVERIVALAEKLVENAESEAVRLSALQLIHDRGHGKVTERHEVAAVRSEPDEPDVDLSQLSIAELEQLEQLERQRLALLERARRPVLDVGTTGGAPVGAGAE